MKPIVVSFSRYDFPELIDTFGYKTGAEIGVNKGYFSYYLLKHSSLRRLVSVDNWQMRKSASEHEAHARDLLSQFGDRSEIKKMSSLDYAATGPKFDFIYIDANHRYPAVKADIEAWWECLNVNGMLAGHDYMKAGKCGVIRAVNEFAGKINSRFTVTREPFWPSWYFLKMKSE